MIREDDQKLYRERGFGLRLGLGDKPAVLVVDLQRGFTDPECPLGGDLSGVIDSTNKLIAVARTRAIPLIFTAIAYESHLRDAGLWKNKIEALSWLKHGSKWVEIDSRLSRLPDDVVLHKKFASPFFGTHLQSTLTSMSVDSLIICGCTTSGCVRAACVDALQHGFRAVVPEECVGDRAAGPHLVSLFDIHQKYSDVASLDSVLGELTPPSPHELRKSASHKRR